MKLAIADPPYPPYADRSKRGSGGRRMIWVKPRSLPGGNRIISMHEVVLLYVPADRRSRKTGQHVPDVLTAPALARGFTGSKPPSWTHWVLDALGYDPLTDAVDDLFPGSGAVGDAITVYGRPSPLECNA